MEVLHSLILSDDFGLYMFGVFFILFSVSVSVLSLRSRKKHKAIKEAINILQEYTEDSNRELTFTQNFESINQKLEKTALARNWDEFVETLIAPINAIEHRDYTVYRNTKRPEVYFSYNEVFQHVRPLINSSTFVGLGLLLTFIGLILALGSVDHLFRSDDAKDMEHGLQMLLATAGAKFWASVSGLGASLLQEIIFSSSKSKDKVLIDQFNDLLEESLVFASQEKIAVDHFGYAVKQAKTQQELADYIAVQIGDKVSNAIAQIPMALSSELEKTFEPIISDISNVANSMGDNNQKALADMAEQFQNQLAGASQTAMDGVVTQLNSLVDSLNQASQNIGQGSQQMNSSLESSFQDLKNMMRTIAEEMMNSSKLAGEQLQSSSGVVSKQMEDAFITIANQQEGMSELIEGLVQNINNAGEDITKAMSNQLSESSGEMNKLISGTVQSLSDEMTQFSRLMGENVYKSSQEIQQSLDSSIQSISNNVVDTFEQTHKTMLTNFEVLSVKVEEVTTKLDQSLASWSKESSHTSTSFRDVNSTLSGINKGLLDTQASIEQTSIKLIESSSVFGGLIDKTSSVVSSLNRNVDKLVAQTEELGEDAAQTLDLSRKSIAEAHEAILSLRKAWLESSERLEGLDQEMEGAFNRLTTNLGANLDRLTDYSNKLDSNASEAIDQLRAMVATLTDAVEDIADNFKK